MESPGQGWGSWDWRNTFPISLIPSHVLCLCWCGWRSSGLGPSHGPEPRHVSCHVMHSFHCPAANSEKEYLYGNKRLRRKPFASITLSFLHRKEQPQPAHHNGRGQRLFHGGRSWGQCFQLVIAIGLGLQFGSWVFFKCTCVKGDYWKLLGFLKGRSHWRSLDLWERLTKGTMEPIIFNILNISINLGSLSNLQPCLLCLRPRESTWYTLYHRAAKWLNQYPKTSLLAPDTMFTPLLPLCWLL